MELEGRACTGSDGTLYVAHAGSRHAVQLAAASDEQLAGVPRVDSPAVIRLDRDPRVTGVASYWGAGDPLHADATLQARVLLLSGAPYAYRDRMLYRIELAQVSAEDVAAMPLADSVERLDQAFASTSSTAAPDGPA